MRALIYLVFFILLTPNFLLSQNYSQARLNKEVAKKAFKCDQQAKISAAKAKAMAQRQRYKKKAQIKRMQQKRRALARRAANTRY